MSAPVTDKERRHRMMTDEDVEAVAAAVSAAFAAHQCRYDIEPRRLERVIAFVEWFMDGRDATCKKLKGAMVNVVVWGIIITFFGWMGSKLAIVQSLISSGAPPVIGK